GSGNLAWVLAKSLVSVKFQIKQVYSRNLSAAEALIKEVGGEAVDTIKAIQKDADIYFMAVSDKAISAVAAQLDVGDK
ncbi:NAD(P)-binding domain-containing protein, partial [Acinetobacter baumannii]